MSSPLNRTMIRSASEEMTIVGGRPRSDPLDKYRVYALPLASKKAGQSGLRALRSRFGGKVRRNAALRCSRLVSRLTIMTSTCVIDRAGVLHEDQTERRGDFRTFTVDFARSPFDIFSSFSKLTRMVRLDTITPGVTIENRKSRSENTGSRRQPFLKVRAGS